MLTMSHYMFDQRLQWASTRYAGRHVIDLAGEPGTSKTCGNYSFNGGCDYYPAGYMERCYHGLVELDSCLLAPRHLVEDARQWAETSRLRG